MKEIIMEQKLPRKLKKKLYGTRSMRKREVKKHNKFVKDMENFYPFAFKLLESGSRSFWNKTIKKPHKPNKKQRNT